MRAALGAAALAGVLWLAPAESKAESGLAMELGGEWHAAGDATKEMDGLLLMMGATPDDLRARSHAQRWFADPYVADGGMVDRVDGIGMTGFGSTLEAPAMPAAGMRKSDLRALWLSDPAIANGTGTDVHYFGDFRTAADVAAEAAGPSYRHALWASDPLRYLGEATRPGAEPAVLGASYRHEPWPSDPLRYLGEAASPGAATATVAGSVRVVRANIR